MGKISKQVSKQRDLYGKDSIYDAEFHIQMILLEDGDYQVYCEYKVDGRGTRWTLPGSLTYSSADIYFSGQVKRHLDQGFRERPRDGRTYFVEKSRSLFSEGKKDIYVQFISLTDIAPTGFAVQAQYVLYGEDIERETLFEAATYDEGCAFFDGFVDRKIGEGYKIGFCNDALEGVMPVEKVVWVEEGRTTQMDFPIDINRPPELRPPELRPPELKPLRRRKINWEE